MKNKTEESPPHGPQPGKAAPRVKMEQQRSETEEITD